MEYSAEKKLRSLAKKLEELIPDGSTPQNVYDSLRQVMISQRDYFRLHDTQFILRLVLYIYSLKKTGDFILGQNMFEHLFFASLFSTNNQNYQESCYDCGGDGYINCDDCDGGGTVTCTNCDGEGDEPCPDCDGTGETYDDDEHEVKCDNCEGSGVVTCYTCDGEGTEGCQSCASDGTVRCDDCDGNGEIDTDEIVYDVYYMCSWNEDFYNRCEMKENTDEPTLSNSEFFKLEKDSIILKYYEDHSEISVELYDDVFYCFGVNRKDEINLKEDLDLDSQFRVELFHQMTYYY